MEIRVINNVPNLNVTVSAIFTTIKSIPRCLTKNKSEDGGFAILLAEEKRKKLGDVKPGSVVNIGDREYIVLDHSTDTTAIIAKNCRVDMTFGDSGDYLYSRSRAYCNGKVYDELARAVGEENIVKHTVDLTADDGTGKSVVQDKVSILTTEQYRRYRKFLPALGRTYWTATRATKEVTNYDGHICCVRDDGVLSWVTCDWCCGVRPFCILNSSVLVD